jgi:hypothetical protein
MGQPVAIALALLVGVASAYCLVRCVVPRWRSDHGPSIDAWHAVMGAAMMAMLLSPVGSASATVQAGVFGVGALWCACHLLARNRSSAHARLGVGCLVMAAMLMPAVAAQPANASTLVEHHHMSGMDMTGMDMSGMSGMAMPPGWLAVAMLVTLAGVVAAAGWAATRVDHRRTTARVGIACEIVMAGAMGYMAALAL